MPCPAPTLRLVVALIACVAAILISRFYPGWTLFAKSNIPSFKQTFQQTLHLSSTITTSSMSETTGNEGDPLALHKAATNGEADKVVALINAGASVSQPDPYREWTALHGAASAGHEPIVQLLLDAGADAAIASWDGVTPLHAAAAGGSPSILQLLLNAGASVSAVNIDGETPLHVAVHFRHEPASRLLVEVGSDVSAVNAYGETPLHGAALRGLEDTVRVLLDAGADMNAMANNKETPVFCAIAGESGPVITRMFFDRGATACTPEGQPLLHRAAEGSGDLIPMLLDNGGKVSDVDSSDGETALHRAAAFGSPRGIQLLLDAGADVMQVNKAGETPLHLAMSSGSDEGVALLLLSSGTKVSELTDPTTILLRAASRGWTRFIQQFSDAHPGLSVDQVNEQGETILHLAATAGSESLAQWALDAGANISAVTARGETALHKAAMRGWEGITRLLLDAGADVQATNLDGESPLHCAASAGSDEATRLLLDAGADVNARSTKSETALHKASVRWWSDMSYTLLRAGLPMFARAGTEGEEEYEVPVDFNTSDKYSTVIQRLLTAKADISVANSDGDTALHLALGGLDRNFRDIHAPSAPLWCVNGADERVKAITQQFLDAGVDIYALAENGETVLHLAALGGWSGAMRLLLDAGADAMATTANGQTILQYASSSGSELAVGLLSEYGVDVSAARESADAEKHDTEL